MGMFIKLRDTVKGDYIRRNAETSKTYIRSDYVRSERKYSCIDCDDANHETFINGDALVYVGFTY